MGDDIAVLLESSELLQSLKEMFGEVGAREHYTKGVLDACDALSQWWKGDYAGDMLDYFSNMLIIPVHTLKVIQECPNGVREMPSLSTSALEHGSIPLRDT